MNQDQVDKLALVLDKDAQDVATKKLQFDLGADVSDEREIVNYASSIEITSQKTEDLIMRCLSQFEDAVDLTEENVERSIKDIISQEMNKVNVQNHRWVSDFNKSINDIKKQAQQQDDDLEIVEDVVIDPKKKIICPISRCPFVNPVKNTLCNHTYSREAIVSMLNGRQSVKCPVAGCNQNVSVRNLVTDEDMIWLLEKRDY